MSYHRWLILLTVLFVLRVLAQLVQILEEVAFLPALELWQGSSLPYPVLLVSQVVIISIQIVVISRVRRGLIRPRTWKINLCYWFGGMYFSIMVVRLLAGLSFLSDNSWFNKSLPAVFHIVLASYILILGHHIRHKSQQLSSNRGSVSYATSNI